MSTTSPLHWPREMGLSRTTFEDSWRVYSGNSLATISFWSFDNSWRVHTYNCVSKLYPQTFSRNNWHGLLSEVKHCFTSLRSTLAFLDYIALLNYKFPGSYMGDCRCLSHGQSLITPRARQLCKHIFWGSSKKHFMWYRLILRDVRHNPPYKDVDPYARCDILYTTVYTIAAVYYI